MKAIILSPGASLAHYTPQPADLVLGVNRAAVGFPCDVWVAGDLPLIHRIYEQVIGSPLLVSYSVSLDNLRDRNWVWRGETFAWTRLADAYLHPSIVNWPWCSFTAAIVYAAWRGAATIDVYGADWKGTADFDGVEAGKNRTDARWKEEQSIFAALQKVLGDKGIRLERRMLASA